MNIIIKDIIYNCSNFLPSKGEGQPIPLTNSIDKNKKKTRNIELATRGEGLAGQPIKNLI